MSIELDPWRVFCEMCRIVAEDKTAMLNVTILPNGVIEMHLEPLEDEYFDREDLE